MITHWDRAVLLHYYNAPPARPEALAYKLPNEFFSGFGLLQISGTRIQTSLGPCYTILANRFPLITRVLWGFNVVLLRFGI